jgi:transposase
LGRIKNEGISAVQASKDHGVSTHTIYQWLGGDANAPADRLTKKRYDPNEEEIQKVRDRFEAPTPNENV